MSSPSTRPYIPEAQKHQKRYTRLIELTHDTTKAAGVMLVAAIASVIVANSPLYEPFLEFWHTEIAFGIGGHVATMSLSHIVNDALMAVFFLLVGLEVKYEMVAGELTDLRQAILPIVAALGGVLAPIVIFVALNANSPETIGGWGVATATDIAFALGILSLLGSRVPNGLKVFLSTLAVADDIVAILVIAIFYGHSPDLAWLAGAAVVLAVLIVMNRKHVYALTPYLILGLLLWLCIFMSGVHSTIAGVLLAFTIPSTTNVNVSDFHTWSRKELQRGEACFDDEKPIVAQHHFLSTMQGVSKMAKKVVPPSTHLEKRLHPWVYFAILPLFALTNADVCLTDGSMGNILANPVFFGVIFGLVIGKPLGILAASGIVVKSGLASLPAGVNWKHMVGAGMLAGVGFTMAIFVANLAFADAATVSVAKAAILCASCIAGIAGFLFLLWATKDDPVLEETETDPCAPCA